MKPETFTIAELQKLLNEYDHDPYNHESCQYKPYDGDYYCTCELHNRIEQFILWVRDRNIGEK